MGFASGNADDFPTRIEITTDGLETTFNSPGALTTGNLGVQRDYTRTDSNDQSTLIALEDSAAGSIRLFYDSILTVLWTSEGVGVFTPSGTLNTVWAGPQAQSSNLEIVITLTVTDPEGLTGSQTRTVTVLGEGPTVLGVAAPTTVNAGEDVTVDVIASNPDGSSTFTYLWSASPSIGSFSALNTQDVVWTAPSMHAQNDRIVTLTNRVTGSGTLFTLYQVDITIHGAGIPSIDSIGANPTTVNGGNTIQLSSTVSDPGGLGITYEWEISPNVGSFSSTTISNPIWTAPMATSTIQQITITLNIYTLALTSDSDMVMVTVSALVTNTPPTVSISADTTSVMGAEVVTLDGTVSDTQDQLSNLTILWSANPNIGMFGSISSVDTTWTAPAATTMAQSTILTLSVTDTGNLTTTAMVTITVAAVIPQAPMVSATADMTTVDGGTVIMLDGTASDPNMEILTYLWTATPNIGTFANSTSLDTTWTAPPMDTDDQFINLTLTVTNTSMLEAMVTIIITVSGTPIVGRPGVPGPPTIVSTGNNNLNTSWIFPDDGGSPITSSSIRYRVAVLAGSRLVSWYPFSKLSKANDAIGDSNLERTSLPGTTEYNTEVDSNYPVRSGAHAVNSLWRVRQYATIGESPDDDREIFRTSDLNLSGETAFSVAFRTETA